MQNKHFNENLINKNDSNRIQEENFKRRISDNKIPKSYKDKMSVMEKSALLNCFANEKEFKLSQSHLTLFYVFVIEADVFFNDQVNLHIQKLTDLFRFTFHTESANTAQVLDKEK